MRDCWGWSLIYIVLKDCLKWSDAWLETNVKWSDAWLETNVKLLNTNWFVKRNKFQVDGLFNVSSSPTCRRLNLRVGVRVSQRLENNYSPAVNITAN